MSERKKKRRKLVKGMREAVDRLKAGKTDPVPIVRALLEGLVYYAELREGLK